MVAIIAFFKNQFNMTLTLRYETKNSVQMNDSPGIHSLVITESDDVW